MTDSITSSVARLYENFPYPHYPLLARPRWQEGYLTGSIFALRLRSQQILNRQRSQQTTTTRAVSSTSPHHILLGGAGEILPYIVRRWEPRSHHVHSLDLSQRSLRRARFRLGWLTPNTKFIHADLCEWLSSHQQRGLPPFQHIDAFGVIHHMPDPGQVLKLFAKNLVNGGTIRLMVYNSPARAWIHQLQGLFRILRVSPYLAADRQFAQRLLQNLGNVLPSLGQRLQQIGPSTLNNEARFVDTFLHPREAKLSISRWGSLLAAAGLEAYALFDRYAELDDLKNPLWQMPDWQDLSLRAADSRFENNLELFIAKPGHAPAIAPSPLPRRLLLKQPPQNWFVFNETSAIDRSTRWGLWHAFLRGSPIEHLRGRLTRPALQRLARIGAILPSQFVDRSTEAIAAASMSSDMEVPQTVRPSRKAEEQALTTIKAALQDRGLADQARASAAAQARLRRLVCI